MSERKPIGWVMMPDGIEPCFPEDDVPGGRFYEFLEGHRREAAACRKALADFERMYPPRKPMGFWEWLFS